jgi:hypothetical protein
MLKNESARNLTKPTPLRPSRLPDSGHIFTSSNKICMQKISRSVRKPKQAKKGDDCTVRTVRTDDVATPGDDTWQFLKTTHGRLMWCMGRQLDQSMGDTCNHCKGDTWHRMTSAANWASTVAG